MPNKLQVKFIQSFGTSARNKWRAVIVRNNMRVGRNIRKLPKPAARRAAFNHKLKKRYVPVHKVEDGTSMIRPLANDKLHYSDAIGSAKATYDCTT